VRAATPHSLEETVEVFIDELSEYLSCGAPTFKCKVGVIFMQLDPKTNLYSISILFRGEECIFEYNIENPISVQELLNLITWKIGGDAAPLIIVKDVKILFRFY
jgi:hypothetical protein